MITIYHNPRCSKSRETLELVQEVAQRKNLALHIVEYLKTPPTLQELTALHTQLGIQVRDMLRDNEEEYASLNLADANDAALLAAVAGHPKLLQRPIVSYRGQALVGRPPERVLALFDDSK
ncbi:arsenate reductase (glutaredoxin) [Undibacterium sp.]|uniref:arsenate reductase (glutaredoxin) n=1 Tax=Undibacterium sp. TaxID=1914977 RepID=UPI002C7F14E7|nr:arsenate reductase (glutaredoxin) [Undibacterium sp.]HTD04341.1 arsenate reductase (glutaredoxin) [Undibacterium sp.]